MEGFWDAIERRGAEPNPYRTGFLQLVAVADSDAQAEELYGEAALYFYNRCLHVYDGFRDAPGYTTLATIRSGIRSAFYDAANAFDPTELTWKDIVDRGYIIAGDADSVVDQLGDMASTLRVGHALLLCHFGNMPKETVLYNTQRIAEDVLPRVRHHHGEWEDRWFPTTTLADPTLPAELPAPAGA